MGTGHWGTGSGRAGRAVVAAVVVLAGLGAATGAHAGTVLVDRGTDGAPGDNYADTSTMTRDGRYVAYTSQASNLTATPTAGRAEMYLLDRTTGISELVSVAADGTAANDNANFGAISDDGNVVAFSSPADNLDPTAQCDPGEDRHGHSIDCYQIYVRNRSANTTVAVAKSWNGDPTDGTTGDVSDITADGRYVVFSSNATNLVPGDTNATSDVGVRDLGTESTTRVSVDANGVQGDRQSWEPVITGDGRFVAFSSAATNLAPGADTAGAVIVVDRLLGTVEARGTDGVHHAGSFEPSLSDDGGLLTYVTYNNMIPADTDPGYDLYLEDRATGVRSLINTDAGGVPGPSKCGGTCQQLAVGFADDDRVDDECLEPRVPCAALLGCPCIDERGLKGELAAVAQDRLAQSLFVAFDGDFGCVVLDGLDGHAHELDRLLQ